MASLENCPTCANPTSTEADQCPSCGQPFGTDWSVPIREKRKQEAEHAAKEKIAREAKEEELRRFKKGAAAERVNRIQEIESQKRIAAQKTKGRIFFTVLSTIIIAVGVFFGVPYYDDYKLRDLINSNPEEFERLVISLEKRAKNLSTADYHGNLEIYEKLLKLHPESSRYQEKFRFYLAMKADAKVREAQAKAAAKAREKQAKADALAAAADAKAEKEAIAEAEKRRKGFHCLSNWDGSHRAVKQHVEKKMKDPDSFEHIETRITPVKNGKHTLSMTYRARNGFGGVVVGRAVATVQNSGCGATVLAIE